MDARWAASRCLVSALLIAPVWATTIACGNKAAAPTKKDDAGATGGSSSDAVPLAMPVLGVDQIKRFNFPYADGRPSYDKAIAAYRKKDWPAVKAAATAALAKDPTHLGAHRLLAAALAQTGEPAAAVDHLVTALAADNYQYAPTLADDDLKSFMASPHGASVQALADKIAGEYARQIAGGLWLVGRRADFAWPREPGVQSAASRGELYAFDRESRRFLRLTHTEHQAVGFVRAGTEVAVLGFDKVDRPAKAGDDAPALIARPWVWVFDSQTWKPITQRIALPAARVVALGYGPGDQLLVSTAPANGRWGTGDPTVSSVDKTTSKLTKVATGLPASRITVSLDDSQVVRIPDGVTATWSGDPPVAASLTAAAPGHDKSIAVPESGAAAQASVALAPDGNHLVFATAADPCAKDAAPSLYVADTRTATFKHLLSAKSRFATRWLGPSLLAYEDGDNAIRLWDAATGREATRIEDKAGLALDVLSIAAAPLCKQAPPAPASGPPPGDELPPEEPTGSGGPVTAPQ